MEKRLQHLEQTMGTHAERLARLEATGEHVRATGDATMRCTRKNGTRLERMDQQLKGLGRSIDGVRDALDDHTRTEGDTFRRLAEDVHVMRGAMEERRRHGDRHPLVRALLWLAGLFGWKPAGV